MVDYSGKIDSLIKRLTDEHHIIEKGIIEFIKRVYKEYSKEPHKYEKYVNNVFENIEKYYIPHVKFEEEEIFPLIMNNPIVEELKREHKFHKNILRNARKAQRMKDKVQILQKLFKQMHEHLKKETDKLLPLLRQMRE